MTDRPRKASHSSSSVSGRRPIDFRSDTVTQPPAAMRQAMAEAEVGDDVFGEDPTVRRLEARVAELLGKEAALFVPSGVMGNQLALKVHTRPGDEVVVAERSHIYHYESGAPALLSGVQLRPLDEPRGLLTPEAVAAAVRGRYDWEPRTRLVCLENTVNKAGGVVYPQELAEAVAAVAREHGLGLHL
ncbi:MAG: threonine aldolase family protein, partial [Rhodothermales bacterium]|nr:threonine aldolase family protein [Rhodothermales bacterium]